MPNPFAPFAGETLGWVLQWLELALAPQAEAKADALKREIIHRSTQGTPTAGALAAIAAAHTAAELLNMLKERDPAAALAYVEGMRRQLERRR